MQIRTTAFRTVYTLRLSRFMLHCTWYFIFILQELCILQITSMHLKIHLWACLVCKTRFMAMLTWLNQYSPSVTSKTAHESSCCVHWYSWERIPRLKISLHLWASHWMVLWTLRIVPEGAPFFSGRDSNFIAFCFAAKRNLSLWWRRMSWSFTH